MTTFSKRLRTALVIGLMVALVCGALFVSAPSARADISTVPWRYETGVPGAAAGQQNDWTRVLADHHGNVYVFFEVLVGTNQANLNVTKFTTVNDAGNYVWKFTRSVNGNDFSVDYGTQFSVAMDPAGNLYAAWTRAPGYTLGHGAEVYVSFSADGGNTWPQVTRANAFTAYGDDMNPSIAVNPADGSLWVTWDQSWNGFNISVSHSTNLGATFGGFANITDQRADYTLWPQLGIDSGGRMYVIYEYYNFRHGTYSLNWTWSDNGAVWAASQNVPSTVVTGSFTPSLLVDSSDRVFFVWYDWRTTPTGTASVDYKVSTTRGATWSQDIPVNQGTIQPGNFPAIAAHGNTVMITWVAGTGLGYVISSDGGNTFSTERQAAMTTGPYRTTLGADENGTFYAAITRVIPMLNIGLKVWEGPTSTPVIASVTPAAHQLTVAWGAVPELDVAQYRVYRSSDGTNYQVVGTVGPSTTSFTDTGLSNGTYLYRVDAVNIRGTPSDPSQAVPGTVGPTTAQLIANLQSQITALQNQLAQANASSAAAIAAARAQIASLQAQLLALQLSQSATAAQIAQLQANITALQNKLNDIQASQATQTISYANLAFEVIVVVLLVVLLIVQMRKPKGPHMMMAQPGQVPAQPGSPGTKSPDEEL